MPYFVRKIPLDPRDYASHKSLRLMAAFSKNADGSTRQAAIEYVVTAHALSKDSTKSLLYDASLNQPGRNQAGDIRIGPDAFEQNVAWLSAVVFHELVHSPQWAYYVSKGVTQIDPNRSDTERRMIALDEYEAFSWTLKRSAELETSTAQQADIRQRCALALIDLDEPTAKSLAQKQDFDGARDELIRQLNQGASAKVTRRNASACCA